MILNEGQEYQKCPPGPTRAVCVDAHDCGMVQEKFGYDGKPPRKVRKLELAFEIEKLMEDGRPFTIRRRFTATLSDRGSLRPFLESWFGRALSREECRNFDSEQLVGRPCFLNIKIESGRDNKEYDQIAAITPLYQGVPPLAPSGSYVRKRDRANQQEEATHDADAPTEHAQPSVDVDAARRALWSGAAHKFKLPSGQYADKELGMLTNPQLEEIASRLASVDAAKYAGYLALINEVITARSFEQFPMALSDKDKDDALPF